jgi:hypothetical protein
MYSTLGKVRPYKSTTKMIVPARELFELKQCLVQNRDGHFRKPGNFLSPGALSKDLEIQGRPESQDGLADV